MKIENEDFINLCQKKVKEKYDFKKIKSTDFEKKKESTTILAIINYNIDDLVSIEKIDDFKLFNDDWKKYRLQALEIINDVRKKIGTQE